MSPFISSEAPDRPSTDLGHELDQETEDLPAREGQNSPQDVVKLFQCRLCFRPYQEAVSLPCGNTICRRCIPLTHRRTNITYPDRPDRKEGFRCPFEGCNKEHALGDCNTDVILNKATTHMRHGMAEALVEALKFGRATDIFFEDAWQATGVPSLVQTDSSRRLDGGQIVSTWSLAEDGGLPLSLNAKYDEANAHYETEFMTSIKEAIRGEMDCQVCYALYYDPLTVGCGHTYCRSCLHRILDHSESCPICRRKLTMSPLLDRLSCPSNAAISHIIQKFWWDELMSRKEMLAVEDAARHQGYELPLFVCTLSFPHMPTFLHVFEPRYRLMIRRCMERDHTFGMVLPKRQRTREDAHFHELGTLLKIVNVQYYPDGRSLVEAVGLSRFRIKEHGEIDGYAAGNVERVDDMSLEEEEAAEAREASLQDLLNDESNTTPNSTIPQSLSDIETLSTQNMMNYLAEFIARMRGESVAWLTEHLLNIYGEPPEDPAVFPWWFASLLPVKDLEKYRLLGTASVRDRLKICCGWVVQWQTRAW